MLEAMQLQKQQMQKTMYGKCIIITWNHETKKCTQKQIDTKKLKILKILQKNRK